MANKDDQQSNVVTGKLAAVSSRHHLASVLLVFLVVLSVAFGGGWLGAQKYLKHNGLGSLNSANQQIISNESQLISNIADEVGESVVSVNVIRTQSGINIFGARQDFERESAGTGAIVSDSGYIVTNRHVVPAGTTKVSVTLSDGTELTDVIVAGRTGPSDALDIAFLKINDTKGKKLKPAKLGDSAKIKVGDKVVAIGNALGQFQNTVTSGIISGFGRSIEASDGQTSESLQNLLQTDAAINEGNSGGPLVNINGEVIAINTAVAGQAQNIGFAIPINDVLPLIKSMLTKGKIERPFIGVRYLPLTDAAAAQLDLPVKRGAYILPASASGPSIIPGSPAEKANLKEGDIITEIDGQKIDEKNSLTSLVGRKSVGESVELTIIRDKKDPVKIKVTLAAAPTQ